MVKMIEKTAYIEAERHTWSAGDRASPSICSKIIVCLSKAPIRDYVFI